MTQDPRPAPRGYDRCPTCGVLTTQGVARQAIRDANIDDRRTQHNTRAAVDLVSNLGAVMEEAAINLETLGEDLGRSSLTNIAIRLANIRNDLWRALRDDQAERAAFLEHFPHQCAKTTTERGESELHRKENHDD